MNVGEQRNAHSGAFYSVQDMLKGRSRLPLAILVAVAAAGAATFLLRPRSGLIEPAAVDVKGYFTAFQLERAEDFRSVQRLLAVGGLVAGTATLAILAWRPPRRLFDRLARRPILGGAATGAGLSVLLVLVELPLSAVSHERAVDVGLSTQSWLPWLGDVAKSSAIDAVFAAAGGALAMALIRRFGRNWWAPAAAVIVLFGVVTIWLFPVVIDPLFNKFEPLRPGPTRSDVLELADRAGVDVGEVYRVDASRRTTAANAYVGGLGKTKRVVLYDNLISSFPRDQMRLVVAHELGHQKHNDLARGLLWLALVAPAGTFLAQALAERFARREGLADPARKPGPAVLPAVALAIAVVSFGFGAASNVLSREVEARADAFSLRLTDDPASFVQLERRLALRNVSDPDPPALMHVLFGTHPTAAERIGIGEAFDSAE
jgi:STE24 endopeptidase